MRMKPTIIRLKNRLEKAVASDMPWAMGVPCRMWSCKTDMHHSGSGCCKSQCRLHEDGYCRCIRQSIPYLVCDTCVTAILPVVLTGVKTSHVIFIVKCWHRAGIMSQCCRQVNFSQLYSSHISPYYCTDAKNTSGDAATT